MTREEAISEWTFRSNHIKKWLDEYGEEPSIRHYVELIDMAIEALQEVQKHEETFEWCHDCKEYDKDNYCCHRWSKTIRNTVEELKTYRPQGEWKHTITWQPYCSNCEYVFGEDEEFSPFWKFCPMCGAEMADNSLVNDITESPNDVIESQNDVIEVVRCKDCDNFDYAFNYCNFLDAGVEGEDFFCAYGERREE